MEVAHKNSVSVVDELYQVKKMPPIRSPRRVYQITPIVANLDDDPAAIDPAPALTEGGLQQEIYVKMKEAVGDYFGLTPLSYNDPIFRGVFGEGGDANGSQTQAGATNIGSTYRRNIGGFRVASYKLISETVFTVIEEYYDQDQKAVVRVPGNFRTMSIGFPKGHSVTEVIDWLGGLANFDNVQAIVTPAGKRHDMYSI